MTTLLGFGVATVLVRLAWRAEVVPRARTLVRRGPGLSGRGLPGRLPAAVTTRLASALHAAGLDTTPEEALAMWACGTVVATLLGAALAPALALPAFCAAGAGGPAGLHLARHRRDARIRGALPDLLDEVARELRSGGTVMTAVARLAGRPGPVGDEMQSVAERAGLGLGVVAALGAWAGDRRSGPAGDDVGVAAAALALAADTGGRAAGALEGTAALLRDRLAAGAEVRALSAQGRWSAAVVACLPVASLGSSVLLGGGAADTLFHTGPGRLALGAGLVLEALGIWSMRRIVRVTV